MFRVVLLSLGCLPIVLALIALRDRAAEPEFNLERFAATKIRVPAEDLQFSSFRKVQAAAGFDWTEVFSDERVNQWLGEHLEKELSGLVPTSIHDPQIAFRDGKAVITCRYESSSLSANVSLYAQVYLTDAANVFAVKIDGIYAGFLPLPASRVMPRLQQQVKSSGLDVEWTVHQRRPLALVRLPVEHPRIRDDALLQMIEVRQGEIVLSGVSDDQPTVRVAVSARR